MFLKSFLEAFNQNFTLFFIFPSIIGIGVYFTCKLRCIQITQMKQSIQCLTQKNTGALGSISRFGALSAVLAGNFGTGNISGMAIAVATGGPGALVWMWLMAFFGAVVQYASCVLGVSFRRQSKNGDYSGGPMYYLRDGLGYKKLAAFFALFTIFGAITVGNFAQINSIILPLQKMGLNSFYCTLFIGCMVALVTLGGIQRLAKFASLIVPLKAVIYLGTASFIIFTHYEQAFAALKLMFACALNPASALGGAMGFGTLKAITTGFDRGLFATDAGTGIVPILQANARSEHPAMDGIATLVAPFMVMIVCTATGLVLILTGAWLQPELQSTNMVTYAFSAGLGTPAGGHIVIATLTLFAYTTILAWSYCGEKALEFLIGPGKALWFRLGFVALVPIGGFIQVGMIWTLSDIAITLMLFINLIGIVKLSHRVFDANRSFKELRKAT